MATLLALVALGLIVWFWVDSLRAREAALRRCKAVCSGLDVQLLDQTVRLVRLRPRRNLSGRLQWQRTYAYEFSTDGNDRFLGEIMLLGSVVELLRLDHPEGPIIIDTDSSANLRA